MDHRPPESRARFPNPSVEAREVEYRDVLDLHLIYLRRPCHELLDRAIFLSCIDLSPRQGQPRPFHSQDFHSLTDRYTPPCDHSLEEKRIRHSQLEPQHRRFR